ncbi:MAG: translation elongation factor Ts [Chitinophagales bacterium]|nr:translation elongation factor Ts [Chitinophagales bacterium]
MSITAADVNKLRLQTGAGMMDCKKALQETNGDFEAAIDYLRKKGAKISEKRADRDANEGVVVALTSEDGKYGVAVNLSCETDFVAKNDAFVELAKEITQIALNGRITNLDDLLAASFGNITVSERVSEEVAKIGEKIGITKFEVLQGEGVVPYIHMGYRMGVLVQVNLPLTDAIVAGAKDAAMQIAAMAPVAVDETGVSTDRIERELEIGREQARNEGKPEAMIDKIAQGKLNKFYQENTLLKQSFVKDSNLTVGSYLKTIDKDLTVVAFKRVTLGA